LPESKENDQPLKPSIAEELSKSIPSELAEDLTSSYEGIQIEFRKGHWDETLWKAGKYAENVFRILEFLLTGKIGKEAPNFRETKEELEKTPAKQLPESMRILVPRIATSLIYDPRSKRATVHIKEISPDYMDASLVITACSWILAEFVRLYHTSDSRKIVELMNELVQRKVPFIETHKGKMFVTKPIDCRSEILLLLLNSPDGASRRDIGTSLDRYYTQGRITQSLQELENERHILKTDDKFVISGVGEAIINKVLSTLV
jgi:hypothetical protein